MSNVPVVGRPRARVVSGTAYETLALLYRLIQADHGLTALDESWAGLALPQELRPAADWFFRGDIALGMNVVPLACDRRWHTIEHLVAGVERIDPAVLAAAMLRSPDATTAERGRRDREVAGIVAGERSPGSLLGALEDERFDVSAAEMVLRDPPGAWRELARLLGGYSRVVSHQELDRPLLEAGKAARSLLDELSLDDAARRMFPQWRFQDLASFDAVVMIPSRAIAPFLSVRLETPRRALVLFPVQSGDGPTVADLVSALKAVAHPQRIEILRITGEGPITGQALAQQLGLTEATVHHHTSLLRAAGLITSNRDAHRVYLAADPERLDQLLHHVRRATHGERQATADRGSPHAT
jgi:DNA-binding transcriptional ArsR family regulator